MSKKDNPVEEVIDHIAETIEQVEVLAGFDIDQQKTAAAQEDDGSDVHIQGVDGNPLYYRDKHGEKKPVIIRVAGAHSQKFRRIEEQLRKRKLRGSMITGEALHSDQITKVVACTLHWEGFTSNADDVPLTPHNARMVYERCPWVLDQLVEAMNDHERFFKKG